MGALRRLREMLGFIGRKAFVEPVAAGRLRENPEHPWPNGLRAIIVVVVGLFAVLAVAGLSAGWLRRISLLADEHLSLPWVTVPFLIVAMMVGLSLLYAAAMHLWVVLRIPIVFVVLAAVAGGPGVLNSPELLIPNAMGVVMLLALAVIRWRARFAAWEFVVVLVVIGHMMLIQLAAPVFLRVEMDGWPMPMVSYWSALVTMLATPAALLAGAAMTELVVTTGSWTARGVWRGLAGHPWRKVFGGLLLAVLVIWAVGAEVWSLATDAARPVRDLPVAAAILLAMVVAAFVVLRWAARGVRVVDPDDVAQAYSPVSWPLAFLVSLWVFGGILVVLVGGVLPLPQGVLNLPDRWLMTALFAVACVVFAVVEARRGRAGRALIAVVLAVSTPFAQVLLVFGWGTDTGTLMTVAVAAAVLVLAWLLVRRRLTGERGLAIGSVLLLSRVYGFREQMDAPLVALLALSGSAAVLLVGLLWRQLTEYGAARGDSRRFPNAARVLLSLANMTLVTMAISMFALSGNSGIVGLDDIERLGDSELGGALLYASIIAGLLLALRPEPVEGPTVFQPVEGSVDQFNRP